MDSEWIRRNRWRRPFTYVQDKAGDLYELGEPPLPPAPRSIATTSVIELILGCGDVMLSLFRNRNRTTETTLGHLDHEAEGVLSGRGVKAS